MKHERKSDTYSESDKLKQQTGSNTARAALSLDLDNQWSYMKIHGDPGWESYPSYLGVVIPRVLDVLHDLSLTVTVFIVGKDAEMESNHESLRLIHSAGHEIGNHSFYHESWMNLNSESQLDEELDLAENSIKNATGVRPAAFRAPGFCLSEGLLRVLRARGYSYDASTLPTYIGPLARAYYFLKSSLAGEEREKRKHLFGSVRDGLRPIKPYYWEIGDTRLLEVPVTTLPILRMPFHLSYVIFLASFSPMMARAYWRSALCACRLFGVEPSILLHPLDFLGGDELRTLAFFPGMDMSTEQKLEIVRGCLSELSARFDVMPLGKFAAYLGSCDGLQTVKPVFYHNVKSDHVQS